MFTGIITATSPVVKATKRNGGLELTLKTPKGWDDIAIGESIASNGVCLTVTAINNGEYTVYLMPETLNLTSFGAEIPKKLNLERALQIGERLSGHIVQGHVDGVGTVSSVDNSDGYRIYVKFDEKFRPLVIRKGSIAIDGVSLTIASVSGAIFSVAIIPHTLQHTTLGSLKQVNKVNLEFDIIGKYAMNLNKENPYAKS